MWTDNETAQDFLNFGSVARTVAEVIEQAKSRPISIGVSGAWGVGKSSMIKLVRAELEARAQAANQDGEAGKDDVQAAQLIFVEFNAWLYQGYDDARAALIDVVASALAAEAQKRKTGVEKTGLLPVPWTGLSEFLCSRRQKTFPRWRSAVATNRPPRWESRISFYATVLVNRSS